VRLEWLPIGGVVDTNVVHHRAALLLDRPRYLMLPAATS
jgi:peptide/nickel transport system permease protein